MMRRFLKYFPVPKYLQTPAYGLDLSDRSLKYVLLDKKNGAPIVSAFGERLIPEEILASGEIKKAPELISFLGGIKEELKARYCVVSLPEEKAFLVSIQMPRVEYSQIRTALEVQIEEYVPLKAEEIIFDFSIAEYDDKTFSASVTAYPSSLVLSYRDVFLGAGFIPIVFEMEMQAVSRAVVPLNEEGYVMLVDFGKTRTTIAVANRKEVVYASTIGVSGRELNQLIMKTLNVDVFKAEEIKKEKGFVKSAENEKLFQAMIPVMSSLKDEIYKHIEYWENHFNRSESGAGSSKTLKKIIILGGESNIHGFSEYLAYELKLPVKKANPWENIVSFESHIPEIELASSLAYASAIGLAIRGGNFHLGE